MATGQQTESSLSSEKSDSLSWVGASADDFSVTQSDLQSSVGSIEEWRENADIDFSDVEGWEVVKLRLSAEDAVRNSEVSGDANILHRYPEVVQEAVETYPDAMFRQPEQESEVVLSQGMSFIDALSDNFERPLKSIGGEWTEMVYAVEEGTPDEVIISGNSEEGYRAQVLPSQNIDERKPAGEVNPEFVEENKGDYSEEHNLYFSSMADLAVGRGYETPEDIRNGELLLENKIEARREIDWEEAEGFEFNLVSEQEEGPKVSLRWDIDVDYGKEIDEAALAYQETSMYAEEFEEFDSVQGVYSDSFAQQYARTATKTSLIPIRAWTAALRTVNGD